MPNNSSDKPSYEEYVGWYSDLLGDDLEGGVAEQWYEQVTDEGTRTWEASEFWRKLRSNLEAWEARFKADNDDYFLFGATQQPKHICTKSYGSVLNKSYRRNVLQNKNWPDPPEKPPSTAPKRQEPDPEDPNWWFGPHNWLIDFPDIFRTRLTTTYFDGVGYLAERVQELAEQTTSEPPCLRLRALQDGYHAAHVLIYHDLETPDYENGSHGSVLARLEIQVTTTIQTTISEMLHRVYEDWRVNGPPPDWQWDYDNSAFQVNYLGSTLHYLEGMIVVAREKGRTGE